VYTAIFIKLFACLVLANAILLKHGDKRAQKMLDECYRTMSLRVLFDSISKGIALVRHWDNGAGFASGIELLLDNAKAQLKSERKVIIDDFHRCMYNWKENNDERPDNLMQAILLAEILAFIGDPEYHHCFKLIKDSLNLHPIEKIVKTHEGYIASLEKRLVSVPKDAAGTRESAKVIGAIRLNRQRIDELQRLIGQQRTAA
jgi:hypothetical protein